MRKRHTRSLQETASICYWPSLGSGLGFTLAAGAAYFADKAGAFKFLDSLDDTIASAVRKHILAISALGLIGAYVGHKIQCKGGRSVYDPYFTRALKA